MIFEQEIYLGNHFTFVKETFKKYSLKLTFSSLKTPWKVLKFDLLTIAQTPDIVLHSCNMYYSTGSTIRLFMYLQSDDITSYFSARVSGELLHNSGGLAALRTGLGEFAYLPIKL